MENIKFFIPGAVPSGGKAQGKRKYMKFAKQFMPNLVRGGKLDKEIKLKFIEENKFHCKVIFFQRHNVDIDNALKTLFDAITNYVIPDDRQIVSLQAKFQNSQPYGTSVMLIRKN